MMVTLLDASDALFVKSVKGTWLMVYVFLLVSVPYTNTTVMNIPHRKHTTATAV